MKIQEPDVKIDRVAHEVIGAAIEVHRALGPGYLESLYEEALGIELNLRKLTFCRQHPVNVNYKQHRVGQSRLDFWVEDCLVVELKAVDSLLPIHSAQLLSYLKAVPCSLGLLINFNVPILKQGIKRLTLSNPLGVLAVQ